MRWERKNMPVAVSTAEDTDEYVMQQERISGDSGCHGVRRQSGDRSAEAGDCELCGTVCRQSLCVGEDLLTNGADCSGFVQSVYAQFGISLPRVSKRSGACRTRIDLSQARPGDLIFYARDGEIYHVVMYAGDGQVVHASSSETGIKISDIYYDNVECVVTLL